MLAFIALSCGDGRDKNSRSEAESSEESMEGGNINDETVPPDSTNTQSTQDRNLETDTTAADGSRGHQ
jgi:hypothetical protein